jgi:hypothetical protein
VVQQRVPRVVIPEVDVRVRHVNEELLHQPHVQISANGNIHCRVGVVFTSRWVGTYR